MYKPKVGDICIVLHAVDSPHLVVLVTRVYETSNSIVVLYRPSKYPKNTRLEVEHFIPAHDSLLGVLRANNKEHLFQQVVKDLIETNERTPLKEAFGLDFHHIQASSGYGGELAPLTEPFRFHEHFMPYLRLFMNKGMSPTAPHTFL